MIQRIDQRTQRVNKFTEEDIVQLRERCEVIVDDDKLEFEGQECCICLAGYENGDKAIKFNKCIHFFHSDCLVQWLKMNAVCPMCKSDKKCELEEPQPETLENTPENEVEAEIELPQVEEPLNQSKNNDLNSTLESSRINLLDEEEDNDSL